MQIANIEIMDFRGIRRQSIDFRDELGRIKPLSGIVGPNCTGKTSILDAISVALMPITEQFQFRAGLTPTPRSIVRRGAVQARVNCTVVFTDDEVVAASELNQQLGSPYHRQVPHTNEVRVEWIYPDLQGKHRTGRYQTYPADGWLLFKARKLAGRGLHVEGISPRIFERCGSVFSFDQQRTGLSRKLSEMDRRLLRSATEAASVPADGTAVESRDNDDERTSDPREILISLASRAQARNQDPEATSQEDFERLCELYAHVCRPHSIRGLYNSEFGLDIEFDGPTGIHLFDGLSSGQQMILLMLLRFAEMRIHRSIVLIDELELHLHPLWQERLYHSLSDLGHDNQILYTTHSTHLRNLIGEDEILLQTGDISEPAGILT